MRLFLPAALALASMLPLTAQMPETGVSRELAVARAARVSDVRYALRFTLTPKFATMAGEETATFADAGSGDLAIDFRDGTLQSASLNDHVLATDEVNGHLMLPAALLAPTNTLKLRFTANIAAAGKAITRYTDKDDGSEYLYTLFVPMDADMAFPCFDQPDLKARFTLTVEHPQGWTVIGNTAASRTSATASTFAETRPISTYLFTFAAGPFSHIDSAAAGEPAVYVRQSQLMRARQEAPAVQQLTARGIAWLSDYFQQPFPFPKYDLVLIPGFPFGGMEHAGATFLNEDGVLFRSTPTDADRFRRDTLVLHETTHQWFGDLVTMRWFDDLWLKEGFAQYMAYKALAALKPETQPWKHFYEDIKPLAYAIDETQGTTPIFQNIPNLKDAKSAYGAIVYQKAPAVLKQLDYRLGEETFRNGLRFYLKQHAYANAQWPDLIHAFEQAGGKDVQGWADAWIARRGMPEVDSTFTCAHGMVASLTVTQKDILPDGYTWPITTELYLGYPGEFSRSHDTLRVSFSTATHQVAEAVGHPCPAFVFGNSGDNAYGRFRLDSVSARYLAPVQDGHEIRATHLTRSTDAFVRSELYGALWENVRGARMAPSRYAELALLELDREQDRTLPEPADESLSRIQGARLATMFQVYGLPKASRGLHALAYAITLDRMFHAPTLELRIVNFRTFVALADHPRAWLTLGKLLDGGETIPGLALRPLDRWNMIGQLLRCGGPDGPRLFAAEQARDLKSGASGESRKYAYAAQAGAADPAVKARYFTDYLNNTGSNPVQEDWLSQSLRPFNAVNQQALTLPYLARALDALPAIKRDRKIFFLGAWLSAFLEGQTTPEAQAIVHRWLAQPGIDGDLRLKVLQVSDELDRTVAIRKAFPD